MRSWPFSLVGSLVGSLLGSLLAVLGIGGCNGASEGPLDPEPDSTTFHRAELVIDLEPVDAIAWPGFWEGVLPVGDAPVPEDHTFTSEGTLALAWGADYPQSLRVSMAGAEYWNIPCEGSFAIEAIELASGSAPGSAIETAGPDAFVVAPAGPGDFAATLTGTFTPASPQECFDHDATAFSMTVAVTVRTPVAVELAPPPRCAVADPFRLESGATFGELDPAVHPMLVGEDGIAFTPANASADRPATITVRGDADTLLGLVDEDRGFYALTAVGARAPLEVLAIGQTTLELELVDAGAIEAVDAAFGLMGGKVSGGVLLESGQVYGADGWEAEPGAPTFRSIATIAATQYVDGEPLCTAPRPDAFVVSSATPATCPAHAEPGHGLSVPEFAPEQVTLTPSAEVIAPGRCALDLLAPDYVGGAGWHHSLEVDLLRVDELFGGSGR